MWGQAGLTNMVQKKGKGVYAVKSLIRDIEKILGYKKKNPEK